MLRQPRDHRPRHEAGMFGLETATVRILSVRLCEGGWALSYLLTSGGIPREALLPAGLVGIADFRQGWTGTLYTAYGIVVEVGA